MREKFEAAHKKMLQEQEKGGYTQETQNGIMQEFGIIDEEDIFSFGEFVYEVAYKREPEAMKEFLELTFLDKKGTSNPGFDEFMEECLKFAIKELYQYCKHGAVSVFEDHDKAKFGLGAKAIGELSIMLGNKIEEESDGTPPEAYFMFQAVITLLNNYFDLANSKEAVFQA